MTKKSARLGTPTVNPFAQTVLKRQTEDQIVPEDGFVKMSFFALDFKIEMPYPLAPPQGWEVDFGL